MSFLVLEKLRISVKVSVTLLLMADDRRYYFGPGFKAKQPSSLAFAYRKFVKQGSEGPEGQKTRLGESKPKSSPK